MNEIDERMNGDSLTPRAAFYDLIQEFLIGTSLAKANLNDTLGVEFTTDQFAVRVYPHPYEEIQLVIDIAMRQLDPEEEDLDRDRLCTLHEINAISRFSTGWITVVDDGDLILSRTMRIDELNGASLSTALSEGIEQAEAYASGWDHLGDLLENLAASKLDKELFENSVGTIRV